MPRGGPPPHEAHVTYSQQFRRCNKPDCPACRDGGRGHGPYWYAYWRDGGRLHSRYVGKQPPAGAVAAPVAAPASPPGALPAPGPPPGATPALRVRTLGGFMVWRGQVPLPPAAWTRRKVAALFKSLLSAPEQRAARDAVLELLWPDDDPATSGATLRLTLHRLRRTLDSGDGGAGYVDFDGETLALNAAPGGAVPADWLDAVAFERAATAALAARDIALCRAALKLYTGDYLPDDAYEEWAVARREALRQLHLALLLHLAELHERAAAPGQAMRALQTLLAADPGHEAAARALMRVQAARGQVAEALRTYHHLAETLRREFDLAPDTETQTQYQELLAGQAAAAARRTNLPTPVTSFIGRSRELAALNALLGRPPAAAPEDDVPACRLLTLTGAGGCGKTRLAMELGRRRLGAYPAGVWIVELAALADAALIVPAVSRALGVSEQPQQPPLVTLTSALAGRELLLILDNCEHLVDGCATLAAALLGACPSLHLLVTSREPLGMLGETVWRVPSLDVADPRRLPAPRDAPKYAALRLFAERARATRPGFALTVANLGAAAAICYQLDGIPLAIELAAARLATLSVDELAARLDDRFRLLAGGNRAALPRHQTLRAVLEWSYALLDDDERLVLQRLSVFAGGWNAEAAEAVCSGADIAAGQVAELVDRLTRKSLAQIEHDGTEEGGLLEEGGGAGEEGGGAGEEGGGRASRRRYRLLETVRQYARESLLAAGEAEDAAAHDRHLAWYGALAERVEPLLQGATQGAWLAQLDTEHDNLRAALRWSITEARRPEAGLHLAGHLALFWRRRGHLSEGRRWLEQALERAPASEAADRALALVAIGNIAWTQGDYAAARACYEQCLALRRALGDELGVASVINNLGGLAFDHGDFVGARTLFAEGLAVRRRLGHQLDIAASLINLGAVARRLGNDDEAQVLYAESLALYRAQGDLWGVATCLNNLGRLVLRQGRCAQARAIFAASLRVRRDLGDKAGSYISLFNLADVACSAGAYRRAALLLGAAAALGEEVGATLPPSERADYERIVAAITAALGEEVGAAVWAQGRALTLEQAIATALAEGPR